MDIGRHYVMLVSRPAMLQDAFVLSEALLQRPDCRVTLIAAGPAEGVAVKPELADDERFIFERERCGPDIHPKGLWRLGVFRVIALVTRIRRKRRAVSARLAILKPDALVVFEDRFIDPEAIWLAEAWQIRLPAMLVRYAHSSLESDIWSRRNRQGYCLESGGLAWLRRAFARRYPDHVLVDGTRRFLFYPTWQSWALALSGMADTDPRVVGGGKVCRVAVHGLADREAAEGISGLTGRFIVTGQPSLDILATERPARQSRIRIICAWPQWAEHEQAPWEVHMALLEKLASMLATFDAEVLISLHPKAERQRYLPLGEKHGLTISENSLVNVLPSADIFLASWSSTLNWSAILGIPSVNLDWIGQAYGHFDGLHSLLLSKGPDDLEELLKRMIADDGFRTSLGEALKREAEPFGTLDGRASARVVNIIDEVASCGGRTGDTR